MAIRNIYSLLALCGVIIIAGCRANVIEGEFSPACMAYAGDTISLQSGEFVWDKFTDQVRVGSDGKNVDQFPLHPVKGTYEVDGERVAYHSDAAIQPDFTHWVSIDDKLYLLTMDEMQQWRTTGAAPRCALVFSESSPN